MATVAPMRPFQFHLAVFGLVLAFLFASAVTGDYGTAATTTTELLHASSNGTCPVREHAATCTVYRSRPYGSVNRALPFAGLRTECSDDDKPVVAGACGDDPVPRHCHVRTLVLYDGPEGPDGCELRGHLPPVANPGAVVAGGGEVCYVEMEHRDHREGYYIFCPASECPYFPFLCCPELPHHKWI